MRLFLHGTPSERDKLKELKDLGFEALVLGKDIKSIENSLEEGFKTYVCSGSYKLPAGKDEKYLSVDINGNRQILFNSSCPNQEDIRNNNLKAINDILKIKDLKGLFLDGARFASPGSGIKPFFTCFCDTCRVKAYELGYDFKKIKKDVKKLYQVLTNKTPDSLKFLQSPSDMLHLYGEFPGIFEWFRFRSDCTVEHIQKVSNIVTKAEREFAVYYFTPSLAPIVGQSYIAIKEMVDIFSPMIYRNYPVISPACLNSELAAIPDELRTSKLPYKDVLQFILAFTGFEKDQSLDTVAKGLSPQAIYDETQKAKLLTSSKLLIPIIYLDDDLLKESVQAVKEGGADGISFFRYRDQLWEKLKKTAALL